MRIGPPADSGTVITDQGAPMTTPAATPRSVATTVHPDPARPGAAAPLFSTWRVGTPERQLATADAIAATWTGRPWPDPNLLSYSVYAADDGDTLMHYSQWTAEQAYFDFARTQRRERVDEIDAAVPGIERLGLNAYRRYRSHVPDAGRRAAEAPGLVVAVDVRFDAGAAGRRTAWIDTAVDALTAEPEIHRGLLGAHFHLLVDGERHLGSAADRVFTYAEWSSAEAYDEARDAPSPAWEEVRAFDGFRGATATRYRLLRSFVPRQD
ncbi:antibiotic biosynthesis monooxygenase [Streptomyces sp. NPDC018031]|uniref:antibiotic biosynthesis monooxygenase n=1 Tax=Streptomyces sp. NPDC018031 TaxID=3365033 RepID=UPI00378F2FA6